MLCIEDWLQGGCRGVAEGLQGGTFKRVITPALLGTPILCLPPPDRGRHANLALLSLKGVAGGAGFISILGFFIKGATSFKKRGHPHIL